MKKKLWTLQLKVPRWQKAAITIILIIFMCGGLLFGTIKMIDATQTEISDCEQFRSECVPREQSPICPNLNLKPTCPLDAAK